MGLVLGLGCAPSPLRAPRMGNRAGTMQGRLMEWDGWGRSSLPTYKQPSLHKLRDPPHSQSIPLHDSFFHSSVALAIPNPISCLHPPALSNCTDIPLPNPPKPPPAAAAPLLAATP